MAFSPLSERILGDLLFHRNRHKLGLQTNGSKLRMSVPSNGGQGNTMHQLPGFGMREDLFPAMPSKAEKSAEKSFTYAVLTMRFAHVTLLLIQPLMSA